MFERYTERARRVLFFARYEASNTGSRAIETEHLLLGLIREARGVAARIFADTQVSREDMRQQLLARLPFFQKTPTSKEVPFSEDTKKALEATVEEANRLKHSYIGTEHLLLGLLHNPNSGAGSVLEAIGLELGATRDAITELLHETGPVGPPELAARTPIMPHDVDARIEQIKLLVGHLVHSEADSLEARQLMEQIERQLDALKPLPGSGGTWFTPE